MAPRKLDFEAKPRKPMGPFRRAVLRGLAILLPPLLTIVILLWVGNTVADYLLAPLENGIRWVMVEHLSDIRTPDDLAPTEVGPVVIDGVTYDPQPNTRHRFEIDGELYQRTDDGRLIPWSVYRYVREGVGKDPMPREAKRIYTWYVDNRWLPRHIVVPLFLLLFVLVLYLLGKFMAAGVGRFFVNQVERVIHRLPLVRNVYSSVKQVTDFMFTERELEYTRVVAVEYPRKGIWTVSFVTGESMIQIRNAAKEPVVSVLIPTSPAPFTGFTITVKKSETVDLDVTVDQALQFIVSCGVVVPPQQIAAALERKAAGAPSEPLELAASVQDDG